MFCISSLQALLSSAIDVLLLMSVDSREYFCYNFTVIHLILSRSVVECVYQRICHKQLSLSSPEPTCFISGRPAGSHKYFKADRLQMIVVAKKYICVATVHQ